VPALLPPEYVGDVHQRLSLYKKLASCDGDDALQSLQEELIDRYGRLPEAARALIETHRLRLAAEKLGVKKIDASGELIVLSFVPDAPVDPARLFAMLQRRAQHAPGRPGEAAHRGEDGQPRHRLQQLRAVFKALA